MVGAHKGEKDRKHWAFGLCAACAPCVYSPREGQEAGLSSRVKPSGPQRWLMATENRVPTGNRELLALSDVIVGRVCLQVFACVRATSPGNTGFLGPKWPACARYLRNSGHPDSA